MSFLHLIVCVAVSAKCVHIWLHLLFKSAADSCVCTCVGSFIPSYSSGFCCAKTGVCWKSASNTEKCDVVQDGPADDLIPSPEGTSLDNLSDVELDDDDAAAATDAKLLPDYILGQYELVKRIKNRWKCTLNHVVMHLNGQDVVVTKAQGELTF